MFSGVEGRNKGNVRSGGRDVGEGRDDVSVGDWEEGGGRGFVDGKDTGVCGCVCRVVSCIGEEVVAGGGEVNRGSGE